jgi:nitrite reductase/ring-hydroxylating ferredoxin subunit
MSKHIVGKTSDIPEGYAKTFEVEDKIIAVFHIDDAFYALDDACPHAGAPLSSSIREGTRIICAWHGAAFDVPTGKCTFPGSYPDANTYNVEIVDNAILVEIP